MTILTNELKAELLNHIINYVNECDDDHEFTELHNECFNEDYYIIGYYQASEWLEKHDIDAFAAIDYVIDYEKSNFGETNTKINSEAIVNMLAYILGEEVISDLDIDLDSCTKAELLEVLNAEAEESEAA
jgi:hypothetical protein